jgi:hypothetical protein
MAAISATERPRPVIRSSGIYLTFFGVSIATYDNAVA